MRDDYRTTKLNDSRSTPELINTALTGTKGENQLDAVLILQYRGDQEVLEAVRALCKGHNPEERSLGAYILGELGIPNRTFPEESAAILLELLSQEQCTDVLYAIGVALGNMQVEKAIPPLAAFKKHAHKDVRLGVVMGLLCQEDEQAIQTLIELSSDEDREVRNWATFGLDSMVENDTEAVRDALLQRLICEEGGQADEIYGEALVGLAERKDVRVINPLLQELSSGWVSSLAVNAASKIGDPKLCDILVSLRDWWDVDNKLLEEAISACTPKLMDTH